MKNKWQDDAPGKTIPGAVKILLKMKLTLCVILISFMGAMASKSYSQTTKLSLDLKNAKVKDALGAIENQSEFFFLYSEKLIDVNRQVNIEVKGSTIEKILDKIFEDTDVNYTVKGRQIVLATPEANNIDGSSSVSQQGKKVSGKVTDSSGASLPGVSVVVKGTTTGVITDNNGNYSLSNISENAALQFSFVAMKTQEVKVGNQSTINLVLVEEVIGLEEVVAVGYGTQKKVNLTGSVSSISTKELESRPITQVSQSLAGLTPGVTVSQHSGSPGNDASTITIRGMGTFNTSYSGNAPLVLIDGLAASMEDIAASDIKSISVLKDAASAAIYGTRAANGVILIETKSGQKGKPQINYSGYWGWQKATEMPQFVSSSEYATLIGGYTADQIAKFKDGSDPDNYPNVYHLENLLKSGSGFQTNHNLSFSGGNDKTSYLFSLGYLNQEGLVAKNDYSRYNLGLNIDSKIKENLDLRVSVNAYSFDVSAPRQSTGDMESIINMAVREPNTYAGKKSDGTYGHQETYSPEAWLDSQSFTKDKGKNFLGGINLSWEILKGLTLSGKVGYKYYDYTNTNFNATFSFDPSTTIQPNNLTVNSGNNSLITLQSLLQYAKTIDKHNFTVLLGASQEEYQENWITAYRDNFPNNQLYELNAGSSTNMQNSGSAAGWALRSYFGRLNYSFNDRYLFEVSARYDGTSRFPSKGRWGLFPSCSAGWRISEESFIKENANWIDNLKLRASWGKLGNQNVATYPYQNVLSTGQNYTFGGTLASGIALLRVSNPNISWETTQVNDIGLDFSVLKNKLSLTFDYYDKTTDGILYPKTASGVLGLTTADYNSGQVKNKGYEISLNYQASLGKLKIGFSPNFSYNNNKVTKLDGGLKEDIANGLFVGQPIGAIYGYVADGIFKDASDVASYATQPIAGVPGVIRFKDISGPSGVPDGKVDATYDQKVIGSTIPKYSYGATITANYKGFDFSMLLQGLGGCDRQLAYNEAFAYYNGGNIQRWQADNAWTETNPNPKALYPKITSLNSGSENFQTSTFWNRSGTFLRLKNLQLGYTLPQKIDEKLGINKLRFFISGQNLFCLNHFYTGWDPEQATGNGTDFYPITSVFTFGVDIKF